MNLFIKNSFFQLIDSGLSFWQHPFTAEYPKDIFIFSKLNY